MICEEVAVIGSGAMGSGIALVLAREGLSVSIVDIADDIVGRVLGSIDSRLGKEVEKGRLGVVQKEEILNRIQGTTDLEKVANSDLVIEAVVEDLSVKGDVFQKLNGICSPSTIFATNTSTLSVTQLGELSGRPGQFLGIHFFNPVHVMKLVEVIAGLRTAQETLETGVYLVERLRKVPVVVDDCPGFLVNRILLPYLGEAFLAVQEGASSPKEIDGAVKRLGFPMGPLELTDMVGIDISVHTFPILHEAYGGRFPVPLILRKLYGAGRLGVKRKKGVYSDGKVDEELLQIVSEVKFETGVEGTPFSAERLILRQVNEAIYCLQEGVASAEDIDRAMVLGTGFPCDDRGVGGPLHWADGRGLDMVLDQLEDFSNTLGQRFWPHHLLKKYVHAGYLGKKTGQGFLEY